jgi:ABC-type branched-subunit amino acid transport system substrate-binding protein/cytochrome c553
MLARISKPYQRCTTGAKKLIVLMSLLSGIVGVADADDELTSIELLGRKIYRNGSDGSKNEITATLVASEDSVSATTFACANCHGFEGQGMREGGLNVPAITSQHLFTNTHSNAPPKQFYDENTLVLAISKGISSQNKPLSAAMPRYGLTDYQAQALLAYLKRLGSAGDVDAGIAASEVQLGTLLPLSGPLAATGKLLEATLNACIAELNSHGPLYGRNVTLSTLDSGSTKREILASTKRLISEAKSFALITGYFPEITSDIYELLAQERLPVIAPLSFVPKVTTSPTSSFFYFLPSYADQSRALVDYWLAHLPDDKNSAKSKLAIVYSDRTAELNVTAAIREQLHRYHLDVMAEVAIPQVTQKPAVAQLTKLKTAQPDAIFFLGNAKEFEQFNKVLAKTDHQPVVLGLLAMLGADVMNISDLAITKMLLASPFALNDPGLQPFAAMLAKYSVSLQSPGLQRIVCASVNFVGEGLKRTGKHLSRARFIQSFEEIKNFPVDIMPPLQFDPNNRQGVRGAYILTVDMKAGILSPLSEWVTPSDAQH